MLSTDHYNHHFFSIFKKRIKTIYTYSLFLFFLIAVEDASAQKEFKQFTYPNGQVSSEGYLVNGKPDGLWKNYFEDGTLKSEGNRVNFELDGLWKFYNADGKILEEIAYSNGLKDGPHRKFTQGLLVQECFYKEDRLDSLCRFFYANGQLKKTIPYRNNFEEGLGFEYDLDSNLIALFEYRGGVRVKNLMINRRDEEGRKQGLFMEFYPDLNVKWEGTFTQDLKDGYFKYYDEDGNLTRSEKWVMGVLQVDDDKTGKMRVKQSYSPEGFVERIGPYRKDRMDGLHRIFDAEGNVRYAELYDFGRLVAKGPLDEQGRKTGVWETYYPEGGIESRGPYSMDLKQGEWIYFFPDSTLEQKGKYDQDLPDGVWKWYFRGELLKKQETYRKGLAWGESVEYDSLGRVVARGSYFEGQRDGRWIFEMNDHKEIGRYRDGLRTGEWKFFYSNGDLQFVGNYVDGLEQGEHLYYFPNGQLKVKAQYTYGLPSGTWNYYSSNGALVLTVYYQDGKEVKYNGTKVGVELLE